MFKITFLCSRLLLTLTLMTRNACRDLREITRMKMLMTFAWQGSTRAETSHQPWSTSSAGTRKPKPWSQSGAATWNEHPEVDNILTAFILASLYQRDFWNRVFWVPIFETLFRVLHCAGLDFESDSDSNSNQVWKTVFGKEEIIPTYDNIPLYKLRITRNVWRLTSRFSLRLQGDIMHFMYKLPAWKVWTKLVHKHQSYL